MKSEITKSFLEKLLTVFLLLGILINVAETVEKDLENELKKLLTANIANAILIKSLTSEKKRNKKLLTRG